MTVRLSPYLLLTGLGLLFFGELVLHPTQVLYSDHSDLLAMHLPMKRFLVRSWQETGEVPLWNPYSFAGMPFIHDVQVAAFYPLHEPLYLLPEEQVGAAMSWLVVLHVLIAGWCAYAYASWKRLGSTGALVAAIGYMFAGKWLLHVLAAGHYILIPLAWLPLVLLWVEQAVERHSLVRATWAGGAFALIVLGAHPQMTLYAGVFIGLWSLGCTQERACESMGALAYGSSMLPLSQAAVLSFFRVLTRWFCLGAWTALVAIALSAVQLLPALEAAPEASRAVGVAARDIVAVALPSVLGLVGPGWVESWEDRGGLGVLWVAAAAMAPLFCRGRARFEAVIALLLLFFSVGGAALVHWLPGFRLFQIPVRMLMLLALPVALLAGRTTQALVTDSPSVAGLRRGARRILLSVLMAGALLACCSGVSRYLLWRQQVVSQRTVLDWLMQLDHRALVYWFTLLVAGPAAAWLLHERCSLPRRAWTAVWLAVLLADLWALARPCVAVHSEADLYAPSASICYMVGRREAAPREHWRVLDRGMPGYPSSAPLGAALPMLGTVQIEPVLGYNSFDIRRYKEYLQFITSEDKPIRPREGLFGYPISDAFPICNKSLLDLLGTRYLLQPSAPVVAFSESGEPTVNARWQRMSDTDLWPSAYSFVAGGVQPLPSYVLFENKDAFPRAFVVFHAVPLCERPHLLQQLKTTDFRRDVLLEGIQKPLATSASSRRESLRPAAVREYLPNRVIVESADEAPGYVVLTDVWFPGWKCTVDGEPAEVLRADFLFRAVAVPAGSHEIVFTFAPTSYRWGRLITLVCICLMTSGSILVGVCRLVTRKNGQRLVERSAFCTKT